MLAAEAVPGWAQQQDGGMESLVVISSSPGRDAMSETCTCGCGVSVRRPRFFARGHNSRVDAKRMPTSVEEVRLIVEWYRPHRAEQFEFKLVDRALKLYDGYVPEFPNEWATFTSDRLFIDCLTPTEAAQSAWVTAACRLIYAAVDARKNVHD